MSPRELDPLKPWQVAEMKRPTRGLYKWPPRHPEALSHQCFLILSGQMHHKHMDLVGFPHPIFLSSCQENEKGGKTARQGPKFVAWL